MSLGIACAICMTNMDCTNDSRVLRLNRRRLCCLQTESQVPLELGWTFSVHRSQGMSLDRVQMSLANVFEYVPICAAPNHSRVR